MIALVVPAGWADELPGGRADDRTPDEFDPDQLAAGLRHEMEHTDDPHRAVEIAMDHLAEDPEYYTHLASIEPDVRVSEAFVVREANEVSVLRKRWPEVQHAVRRLAGDDSLVPPEFRSERGIMSLDDLRPENDDDGRPAFYIGSFILYVLTSDQVEEGQFGSSDNEEVLPEKDGTSVVVVYI